MLTNEKIIQKCINYIKDRNKIYPINNKWDLQARENQKIPTGDWMYWLILAGRGFGKTRTGSETIRIWVESKQYSNIALIGQTIDDVKKIMIEGVSGILNINHRQKIFYEKSKDRLVWENGAKATFYGGDFYEKLRGPQFDCAWIDELCKFKYPEELWQQLSFSLRLGKKPRCVITTTPKPIKLIKDLIKDPTCHTTTGSTFENSKNLSQHFLEQVEKQFANTKLGKQELYAKIIDDNDSLWKHDMIKYSHNTANLKWQKIVIAIDPAVKNFSESDETGIIVAGKAYDDKGYILEDLSGKFSPNQWACKVVQAYHKFKASKIIAETNQGGDMVEKMLKVFDKNIFYKSVHATRSKSTRAEPIVALYEKGLVFHAKNFDLLENQMCNFSKQDSGYKKSPDRLDALVWALTELFFSNSNERHFKIWN